MQGHIYPIHVTSQPLMHVITPTVLTTSHPLFVWHHTLHMCSVYCTIEDITSSLYDIKAPFLWHHTHYIWHHIQGISVITSTVLMILHHLYLWDLIHYIWRPCIHCIQHHIHYICKIIATISLSHTHSIHDITPTICLTSDTLYKASRLHFMTSHHIIYDITCTILMTSLALYLTLHPLYLCHHNHSIADLRHTVCMTSHPLYILHLMHYT